jgi:mRNA interferase RelE/StbE
VTDYKLEYRPEVYADDFPNIPRNIRERIIRAIEQRLMTNPTGYGKRLAQSLTGLWKVRVGDYRIVYEIEGKTVTVWAIRHRNDVYEEIERRWLSE